MSVKFAHIADVHLGYRQYGSEERAIDFAQAFMRAVKRSLEENVDFILIAGDLFHRKSDMDPLTLTQAIKVLEKAKKAKVPVFAVEGNHDSAYFRETFSWLDYLSQQKLLINLKPSFDDGIIVEEWDGSAGAYFDLDTGVRIYGMKYYGSMTEKVLEEYARKVKRKGLTIFMAHAGVEGYVNIHGCVPSSKFHRIKADYIALGHIHRSFVEGKIHNPGSLEVCDVSELKFDRGFFIANYDGELKAELHKVPTRDFVVVNHEVKKPEDLKELGKKRVKAREPVVYVILKCPRSIKKFLNEEEVKSCFSDLSPLLVRVKWEVYEDTFESIVSFRDRKDIELSVISQLLESYPYGNIGEEVVMLKNAFASQFDNRKVDEFVERILFNWSNEPVQTDYSAEFLSESKQKQELKRELKLKQKIKQSKARKCMKAEASQDEEEVWDWRKAYDLGSKARKR